jgi:Lon protease-like protein
MEEIGLFPLGNVLFPESVMPMHIFEEKYIKLINFCYQNKIPFGINLKLPSKIYDVGCTATISDISTVYDDSSMDIIVIGIRRYKIIRQHLSKNGYFLCEVIYFDDVASELNVELIAKCVNLFNVITETVKSLQITKIELTKLKTNTPSFLIAQKSGLSLRQKQFILELNTENTRLNYIYNHLNKILPMIQEAEYMFKIIKYNGYYRPKFYR